MDPRDPRRGGGAAAALTLLLSCAPTWAQPPNDTCATAIPITEGITNGSNVGATTSSFLTACNPVALFGAVPPAHDVWYLYLPSCTGAAIVSLCAVDGGSSNFRSWLGAYSGTCPGGLVQIVCDGTYGGMDPSNWLNFLCSLANRPRIIFPVTAGVPVYLAVASAPSLSGYLPGNFSLSVACVPPPGNDTCTGALPLVTGGNGPFSNLGATTGSPPMSCGQGFNDVWFSWMSTCLGTTRISCGWLVSPLLLSIHDACGGAEVACSSGGAVEFFALSGATYWIRVAGPQPMTYFPSFNLDIACIFDLVLTAPLGAGSLAMMTVNGPPGHPYLTALTQHQGSFPNGWLFGVDMPLTDLAMELAWPGGFPFTGVLDAGGHSPVLWIPSGVAPGITIYGVTVDLNAPTGLPVQSTSARSFTTW